MTNQTNLNREFETPYFEATRRDEAKCYTAYKHMTMATRFSDPV